MSALRDQIIHAGREKFKSIEDDRGYEYQDYLAAACTALRHVLDQMLDGRNKQIVAQCLTEIETDPRETDTTTTRRAPPSPSSAPENLTHAADTEPVCDTCTCGHVRGLHMDSGCCAGSFGFANGANGCACGRFTPRAGTEPHPIESVLEDLAALNRRMDAAITAEEMGSSPLKTFEAGTEPRLNTEDEILVAQQMICEAIERRFKELIPHELEHYACKLAARTLRRTIDQLMSLPPKVGSGNQPSNAKRAASTRRSEAP